MPGSFEFSNLIHYKSDNIDYYDLKIDGASIIEYLVKGPEHTYILNIPLLGSYKNAKNSFFPDNLFTSDWYTVRLFTEDNTFAVKRYGTTGWL